MHERNKGATTSLTVYKFLFCTLLKLFIRTLFCMTLLAVESMTELKNYGYNYVCYINGLLTTVVCFVNYCCGKIAMHACVVYNVNDTIAH